jgi:hypothetical protein
MPKKVPHAVGAGKSSAMQLVMRIAVAEKILNTQKQCGC